MVSTHSQYINDCTPQTTIDKSPLAMLAKTCETIGLPDSNSKKSHLIVEKKEENKKEAGSSAPNSEKKKETRSPTQTPTTSKSEPTVSTTYGASLGKHGQFPMAFAPMGFYPGMMPFPMSAGFPFMNPFMAPRMPVAPCPYALMRQACLLPGCTQCMTQQDNLNNAAALFNSPYAAAAAAAMMQVPTSMASYQHLLASAKPHCTYMDASGVCGKKFDTMDELTGHLRSHQEKKASSPSVPARYHPYSKPSAMPNMPLTSFNPLALQAMYAQRMMPHP